MANKVIIGDEPEVEKEEKPDSKIIEGAVKRLSDIDFKLDANALFAQMPFIIFCCCLIAVLIWSSHNNDQLNKKIEKLTKENKELRNQYIITLSEMMNASRQSAIAERLRNFKIMEQVKGDTNYVKEATIPPVKITIK